MWEFAHKTYIYLLNGIRRNGIFMWSYIKRDGPLSEAETDVEEWSSKENSDTDTQSRNIQQKIKKENNMPSCEPFRVQLK